jgi:hypothetical protein
MRVRGWYLVLLLVPGLAAWGQQKPTLGKQEPSLHGPRSATTTDPRRLSRVRAVYVERIDNSLSDRLMEGLSKSGRFRVVADRGEADAVLRGTCSDYRRLKTVRTEVYLNDSGGESIWQDNVRRPYNPPPLKTAVDETADIILAHLVESAMEADRK